MTTRWRSAFLTLLLVCLATTAGGQVPEVVSYQGLLTLNGVPLNSEGVPYSLRFRIFDSPGPGGLNVPVADPFDQTIEAMVTDGLYSVLLSGMNLREALAGEPRYLEVTIEAGPGIASPETLTPRQRVASVPYALSAGSSDTSNSSDLGGPVQRVSSTATDSISDGSWTKLAGLSASVAIPDEGSWVVRAQASVQVGGTAGSPLVAVRLLRDVDGMGDEFRMAAEIEVEFGAGPAPTRAPVALFDVDDVNVANGSVYTYSVDARRDGGGGAGAQFNLPTTITGHTVASYLLLWVERAGP